MNDDQQPNQEEQSNEMTNPWPDAPQDAPTAQASPDATPDNPTGVVEESIVTPDPVQPAPQPVMQPQMPVGGIAPQNPGQGLGIASIVLGVLAIWVVGLPLAIVSMTKSSKANAPKTLGIIGLVLNILGIFVSGIIILSILIAIPALQERARELSSSSYSSQSDTAPLDTSDVDDYDISLSQNYTSSKSDIWMTFPVSYSGWSVQATDSTGLHNVEMQRTDGNAAVLIETMAASAASATDRAQTDTLISYQFIAKGSSLTKGTETSVAIHRQSDGKGVEFTAVPYEYESDGTQLKGILALRACGDYAMIIDYKATTSAFDVDEWKSIMKQIEIND